MQLVKFLVIYLKKNILYHIDSNKYKKLMFLRQKKSWAHTVNKQGPPNNFFFEVLNIFSNFFEGIILPVNNVK